MIINSIKLHNIRSYVDGEIKFDEGNTLLAGDVGSGKSSILLAVDFALFGITKNLSGNTLLRNGAKSGYVELNFNVDSKNVTIRRSLVRSKSIVQDEGYIQIDGKIERGTAQELKQSVLGLLNYPKELLTKSKNLVYRYTVYTPQEEMKKILQEDSDARIDILRKIFGIDKYKTIKDNVAIFSNHLRDSVKNSSLYTADIDAKKKELNEYAANEIRLKNEIDLLKPRVDEMKTNLEEKKKELCRIEDKLKEANRIRSEIEVNMIKTNYLSKEIMSIKKEIGEADAKINSYGDVMIDDSPDVEDMIKSKKSMLEDNEKKQRELLNQISMLNANIGSSNLIVEKINSLDSCPICKQVVSSDHKHIIKEEEAGKRSEMNEKMTLFSKLAREADEEAKKLKSILDELNEKKQTAEINKIKIKNMNEAKARKEHLEKRQEEAIKNLADAEDFLKITKELLAGYCGIEETYGKAKESLEKHEMIRRELEIKHTSVSTRFNDTRKIIELIEKDIGKKIMIMEKSRNMEKIRSWLNGAFIGIIDEMERKVMSKVYADFNELFKKWFGIIMGDEGIAVALDSEFNPGIEQNGYSIEYENLSGGEKTAVALAYRLSLNQVINNLIVNIKTNDLIILDEPTDGFSDDQINRIKNILDELNIRQVIIVSHEPMIESFVDNVINVNKEDYVSKIGN